MNADTIRVILAGGGTGGHIFPAIAIAGAIRRLSPQSEILFVGARNKMEMDMVPIAGYEIKGLDISGIIRGPFWKNLSLPWKILKSLINAREILRNFRPNVVIGTGGYASFPMLYMAERSHIPVLIQEQNSLAGKANKFLGKKAARICVAYEGMERFFPADKLIITGNPVRSLLTKSVPDRENASSAFGLDSQLKTLLVIGGSQGANSINKTIGSHLHDFMEAGVQLIWQTGKNYFGEATQSASGWEKNIKVFEFISQMDHAYQAADIVISRAGALTISELCIVGKPTILVPYPFAAEDHQNHNALALVKKDAALMVRDNEVPSELVNKIFLLLHNDKMREILASNLSGFGRPDADTGIAKEVFKLFSNKTVG